MLAVGQRIVVEHSDGDAAVITRAFDFHAQVAQINHRLGIDAFDSRVLRLARRIRFQLDALRRHPMVGGDDEQRGFEQAARAESLEHGADPFVGAIERLAQALVMRAVVVAGAVGKNELVRDKYRSLDVSPQCSKRLISCAMPRMSTISSRVIPGMLSAAHRGLTSEAISAVSALSRTLSPTMRRSNTA